MRRCCRIKKPWIIALLMVVLPVCYLLSHFGVNYFTGNVHTVIPDVVYRSAQLNDRQLLEYTQKFHLKTIINLRGAWPSNHWYQAESQFAKTEGLHYYPLQFSAYRLPSKDRLRELVQLLQTAPKPLLFHCEGGADRTGMAAAISMLLFKNDVTMGQLKQQASWRYNVISRKSVGYQVLQNYFTWLQRHHYATVRERFLQWVDSSDKMKPYHGRFWV